MIQRFRFRVYYRIDEYEWLPDWVVDLIERIVSSKWLCKLSRHEPIDDHCMRPEHRYCVYCRTMLPYAEIDSGG